MIGQKQLVTEIAKFDDTVLMEDGYRKEQIDRAIEVFGVDKDMQRVSQEEEEDRLRDFQSTGAAPATTKQIVLD